MSTFQVARDGHRLIIKVEGSGNMRNAPILDAFLAQFALDPLKTVCLDLSQCTGMDSTFMGLLVGSHAELHRAGGALVVANPSEICSRLMSMLGLIEVIPTVQECAVPSIEFIELDAPSVQGESISTQRRLEVIHKAHRSLMAINDANKAQFSAFMEAMERDLAKKNRLT